MQLNVPIENQLNNDLGRFKKQQNELENSNLANIRGARFLRKKEINNKLTKENNFILKEMTIAKSNINKRHNTEIFSNLTSGLNKSTCLESQIFKKERNLRDRDQQIKLIQKQIALFHTKLPSNEKEQKRIFTSKKELETLENKLDTVTKQICAISWNNRKLREEVEHFLQERIQFTNIWKGMIQKLAKGKLYMLDLSEQAAKVYEQRDEWCYKLQVLRNLAHSQSILHMQEIAYLHTKLHHQSEAKTFFTLTTQRRSQISRKNEKREEKILQKLNQGRQILSSIQKHFKDGNVTNMISEYQKNEEFNNQRLKLIIYLKAEIMKLNNNIFSVNSVIDEHREISQKDAQSKMDTLTRLRNNLKELKEEVNVIQQNLENTGQVLSQYYNGLKKLFKICKCEQAPLSALLGMNMEVSSNNVQRYLVILDDTISTLLVTAYYEKEEMNDRKSTTSFIVNESKHTLQLRNIDQLVPANPCPICVYNFQTNNIIDVSQSVHTRNKTKEKLYQALDKAENKAEWLHNFSACNLPESREILLARNC